MPLPETLDGGQPLAIEPPTLRLLVVGMALTGLPLCVYLRRLLTNRPSRLQLAR